MVLLLQIAIVYVAFIANIILYISVTFCKESIIKISRFTDLGNLFTNRKITL